MIVQKVLADQNKHQNLENFAEANRYIFGNCERLCGLADADIIKRFVANENTVEWTSTGHMT